MVRCDVIEVGDPEEILTEYAFTMHKAVCNCIGMMVNGRRVG